MRELTVLVICNRMEITPVEEIFVRRSLISYPGSRGPSIFLVKSLLSIDFVFQVNEPRINDSHAS